MAAFPFRTDEGAAKFYAKRSETLEKVLQEGPDNLATLMPRIMEDFLCNPTDDPFQFICNWYARKEYDYDMRLFHVGNEEDGKTIKEMSLFAGNIMRKVSFEDIRNTPALRKEFAKKIGDGLLHLLEQAATPMLPEESEAAANNLAAAFDVADNAADPVFSAPSSDASETSGNELSTADQVESDSELAKNASKRKVSFGGGIQADFSGGEMTANAGMLLIKKFCKEMKLDLCMHQIFKLTDQRKRQNVAHPYSDMIIQIIYTTIAGFYTDASAKAVVNDPTFKAILNGAKAASQPSICRMFQNMDQKAVDSLNDVLKAMREIVYALSLPSVVVFDIDTTHVDTYGHQEKAAYCTHYQSVGFHPQVMFDALTRDPIKAELRPGSEYCSKPAADFLRPVFEEYREKYPSVRIILRADSGYAAPEVYELCEEFGVEYLIRLKDNPVLRSTFKTVEAEMAFKMTEDVLKPYLLATEGTYQAKSWMTPRRVIGALDKKSGMFLADWMFIVTNVTPDQLSSYKVVETYRGRGIAETFIGECKRSFGILHVSSESFLANSARFLVHIIAYAVYNWFSRLAGKDLFGKYRSETIRDILLRIPAKVTVSSRYTTFHMAGNYQSKDLFFGVYDNIDRVVAELKAALANHQGELMMYASKLAA